MTTSSGTFGELQGSFTFEVDNSTAVVSSNGIISDDVVNALVEAVAEMAGVDASLVNVVISIARRLDERLAGRIQYHVMYTILANGISADITERLEAITATEAASKVEDSLRAKGINSAVEVLDLTAPIIVGLRTSTTFGAHEVKSKQASGFPIAAIIAVLAAIPCLGLCLWLWRCRSRTSKLEVSEKKHPQRSCSARSIRSRASSKSAVLSSQPSLSSLPKSLRRSASLLGMEEGSSTLFDDFDMIVTRL